MPESASEIHRRSADALRMPPVEEWASFPFDGDMRPRALRPPEDEPALRARGRRLPRVHPSRRRVPVDRRALAAERVRAQRAARGGDPRAARAHAAPGDLPDDLARECGVMLGRVERAVRSLDGIGRVHVCRWGEGAEHLHWWFMGRPAGLTQLMSSFAAIWDDVLPPTPQDVWRDNLARVVEHLPAPGQR